MEVAAKADRDARRSKHPSTLGPFRRLLGFVWPHNWLVQALCHAKLGQMDSARAAYEKSLQWLKQPGTTIAAYRHEALLLKDEFEALLAEMK